MPHNAEGAGVGQNDTANMAKLKKSMKQRQRREMQMREKAAKLTPSQIRAMNSRVALPGEKPSAQGSANSQGHNATPPDSPTGYQAQQVRTSTACPPTPPQSPKPQQAGSGPSSNLDHHPPQAHTNHFKARETKRSDMVNANGSSSRRDSRRSASSSSTRSLPMYRGHEMTQAGSMNMLRRPSLDIVNNPLSMFSRPRQAVINPAPDTRRTFPDLDPFEAQAMLDSAEAEERRCSRQQIEQPQHSRNVSPVSMEYIKTPDAESFPLDEPDGSGEQSEARMRAPPIESSEQHVIQSRQDPVSLQQEPEAGSILPAAVMVEEEKEEEEKGEKNGAKNEKEKKTKAAKKTDDGPKKSHRMRFSLPLAFLEKKEPAPETADKSWHTRSVTFSEPTDQITAPRRDSLDASLGQKKVPPSHVSPDGETTTHHAVRPNFVTGSSGVLSSTGASSFAHSNGYVNVFAPAPDRIKPLAPLSIPETPAVSGRCRCCGKLKRPVTFYAELSPVLENENLRPNMGFAQKIETTPASSSLSTHNPTSLKPYTPIVPMEVIPDNGQREMVKISQASIAPPIRLEDQESPLRQNEQAPPLNRDTPRPSEEGRLVRFASLHGLHDEFVRSDDVADSKDEVEVISTPIVDPLIQPRGYTPIPLMGYDGSEIRASLETLSSNASIETARPVSMVALHPETTNLKPAMSAKVDDHPAHIQHSELSSAQLSRQFPRNSFVAEQVTRPPSETAPEQAQTRKQRVRSSLVDEWYMNAIREGPKQDVITVVGWDHHKTRTPRHSEANERNNNPPSMRQVRPPMKVWPLPPETRIQGGKSSFEALVAVGDNRPASTPLLTSPVKEKHAAAGTSNKRRSMMLGLF